MPTMRTLYLDTETTGLRPPYDEIVELALVDDHGLPLIDTLVRPTRLKAWPEAQAIHGISPADVRDALTLEELVPALLKHLTGARLVIYNAAYDWRFFSKEVQVAPAEVVCCMLRFAEHYGDWNDYRQNYRWQRLTTAAEYIGHQWQGKAHRAFADAHACRAVWRYLDAPEDAQRAMREAVERRQRAELEPKPEDDPDPTIPF